MKVRDTKTVNIIFEDYELPVAMVLRNWYKEMGYVVADEFIEVPEGEQGYVVLFSEKKLDIKKFEK